LLYKTTVELYAPAVFLFVYKPITQMASTVSSELCAVSTNTSFLVLMAYILLVGVLPRNNQEIEMAAYLKVEETIADSEATIKNDLMGLSLLALLISPWAMVGLALSMFGYATVSFDLSGICISVLLTAIPKALELLLSHQG